MAMTTKDHTPIEIKAPQPRVSIDFASDELGREQRVPFFRPLSQRRENTWIISLFVILHLVAFAATMIVNDCWKNSHRDCALKPLGRLSFQPLSENPLLGPSSSACHAFRAYPKLEVSQQQAILSISVINLALGLLPYVNNFANIGGFISGFLLGFALLFNPLLGKMAQNKGGLFEYDVKCSVKLRQKLDKPVLRTVSLVLFSLLLAGVIVAVLHGVNVSKYCGWCQYVDCVPSKWWSCNDKPMHCETEVTTGRLTLTCEGSDKFRVFPFTDISQARIEDLCNLICS
ncbi:hypothetical protein HYC85_007625 [Camellia sinensis]|uniref:RHOMBOID-like protein n=1 Tax=Camellia sinensis TaxID=4442 RepID=A0A7J7HQ51_CAMSI|nr:hypothetical protein HYC85_007625 [Camellia sinensis]